MRRKMKKTGIFFAILLTVFGMQTKAEESTEKLNIQEEQQYIKIPKTLKKKLEVPEIEKRDWEHAEWDGDTVSIKKERIGTRNGNMKKTGQMDTYFVTPPVDGTYRFEIEQMKKDASVFVSIQSLSGQKIEKEKECQNKEEITAQLKAGETYRIIVRQKKSFGTYQVNIEYEKSQKDISGYTEIWDSMEYKNQCNHYIFKAETDGRYRVEIEEAEENASFSIMIKDHDGRVLYELDDIKKGQGITLDGWIAGEKYTIDIIQHTGIGDYILKIGVQKKKENISDADMVEDQMEFEDQINRYHFSPKEDGSYVFMMREIGADQYLNMTVFDASGNIVATESMLTQDSSLILENGKAQKQYEIQIQQEAGFDTYKFSVEKEVPKALLKKCVEKAIESGTIEAFWKEAGNYEKQIRKQEEYHHLVTQLESYLKAEVIYEFGPYYEELKNDTIKTWILFDEETNSVTLNETKIYEYTAQLAARYDTYNKPREFLTSDGTYVTVYGGSGYGWMVDQYGEAEALKQWITDGQTGTRRPIFAQEAASFENSDIGYDYVEVDLTYQYVYMYIGGQRIVSSPCVSGDLTLTDRTTPEGTYTLYYKQSPATLVGPDYVQPVTYWMPFNGGIGLHDATWRGEFGGQIYVSNGSHGCINLPYYAAEIIYQNIYSGMPIICYYRW